MDPQVLDCPLESERSNVSTIAFPSEPQDWSKYYDQQDPGTSTDILDNDEAKQTTSLILQQASAMAAEGGDETPLLFTIQTAATIADLAIEGLNPDEPPVSNIGTNVSNRSVENRAVLSPERMQATSGVPATCSRSNVTTSSVSMSVTQGMFPTVTSVVPGSSIVASMVPYDRSPRLMPSYNSSAMYEDSALPVYVDCIGNIMPILDRQSIASNWPLTPHPLTGQIRYVPFYRANMPTVPYIMGVGSPLLPQPIRGQAALSEITPETQPDLSGDSVSQIGAVATQVSVPAASTYVESPEKKQVMFESVRSGASTSKVVSDHQIKEKLMPKGETLSSVDMELMVPYVDQTQREVPFIDFMIPLNLLVRVSTVYAGHTALLSERGHQMCLVNLANMYELYGTEMFAFDKVTGEMYAVVGGAANKIDCRLIWMRKQKSPQELLSLHLVTL